MGKHHHFSLTAVTDTNNALKRKATYASIGVAAFLILIKLYAWRKTGSVSLLSTLLESTLDFFISFLNMCAVRYAMKAPSKNYRFGYGKIEPLSALVQAVVIFVTGIFVFKEAFDHVVSHSHVTDPTIGVGVMVIALITTTILVRYQTHVIKKTESLAIKADSLHYKSDVYIHLGVIFSLLMNYYFSIKWIDTVFGIGISVYIIINACRIFHSTLKILLDHELPLEDRKNIIKILESENYDKKSFILKTRTSGTKEFIHCDIFLKPNLTLNESHVISEALKEKILKQYSKSDVTISVKPYLS